MDELERQRELLERTLDEFNRNGILAADTLDEVNKSTSAYSQTVKKAEDALDRFSRSGVGKATKATGDLTKGFVNSAQAARTNRESFESLNPVIEGAAAALSAIPIVGDALGKTLSTVGTFVTAELQKSVEAFQTLGNVGAVGAGGVTGLRKSAEEAGLAFDQLAKITRDNSNTLAFAFGSTSKGLENLAKITSAAEPFRRELVALGFGITEQTEIFADFLQVSRRLGRAQSNDYRVLASGAAEYAKRLDRLSRLTGESTDALQSEIDAQQSNIRFRSALRGLPDTVQDAVSNVGIAIAAVGKDPELTRGFQDLVAGFGTEAGANFAIATGGVGQEVADQLRAGAITEQEALQRIQQSLGRTFDTLPAQVFGLGTRFDATALGMANLADASEFTADRIRDIVQAQTDAKNATDGATSEMVDAQLALQRFAQEADKFVNDQIFPKAVGVVSTLTDSLSKLTGGINQLASGEITDNSDRPDLASQSTRSVIFGGARAEGGPIDASKAYLVGELGPEIVVPDSSGTVLTNDQVEAKYATVQKALSDVLSLTEGFKSAFLPGIGEVAQYNAGGTEVIEVKGLDGVVETFQKFSAGTLTGRTYATGDQTYAAGTYNAGDLQANTGFFPTSGPRSMYESMMSGIANPMTDASFQQRVPTGAESFEMKEVPLNREAMVLLTELKNTMAAVATNTKTGADTSKQLLRASTS